MWQRIVSAIRSCASLALIIWFSTAVSAQEASVAASPAITAAVTTEQIRFISFDKITHLRLEVFSPTGERLFDSNFKSGDLLDWNLRDRQGQRLADGSYLCVVTVNGIQGRSKQRFGTLSLSPGQATLQRVREQEVTDAQKQSLATNGRTQASDPTDADNALTILQQGKTRAATVTAHDGQDGQVTSTTGALTFRTGDTLAGLDREQVRITPEGRVGIGTDKPEAELDVAGTIRARGGIKFDDGTVLTSAKQATTSGVAVTGAAGDGGVTASVAGTGTANKLTKWLDTNGTLGDSAISEANGRIGIGTNTPAVKLDVVEITGQAQPVLQFRDTAANSPRARLHAGTEAGVTKLFFEFWKDSTPSKAVAYGMASPGVMTLSDDFIFSMYNGITWSERMRIQNSSGNLGVGTVNPTQKLEVAGNIKLTGAGSALIFPDGTTQTTAGAGGGSGISGTGTANTVPLWISGTALGNSAITQVVGNIGIGMISPGSRLTVGGVIESTTGGIKFPDGTVQTTVASQGPTGPQGPQGPQGATGPQGPSGPVASLACTTVTQNYSNSIDLNCPSGYTVVVATCTPGGNLVLNGQTPPPPGGTWITYLIPDASSATGVHCKLGGIGSSSQANMRCCKTQ